MKSIGDIIEVAGKGLVLAFIVLLVIAATYLALGEESIANVLAEYAYYSLVASVILLIVSAYFDEDIGTRVSRPKTTMRFKLKTPLISGLVRVEWTSTITVSMLLAGLVGSFILSATGLQLFVIPGRPTIILTYNGVYRWLGLVFVALSTAYLFLSRRVLAAIIMTVLVLVGFMEPLLWIFVPVAYIILVFESLEHRLLTSLLLVFYLILVILMAYSLVLTSSAGLAWGLLSSAAVAGLIVGFASVALTLYLLIRYGPVNTSSDSSGGVSSSQYGLVAFLGGILGFGLAILSVMVPHVVYGWYVVSLDTVFNMNSCSRVVEGDFLYGFRWSRPLYAFTVCYLPYSLGVNAKVFFDVVLPIFGLSILGTTIAYILYRWGYGVLETVIGVSASLAYWAPFFVYSGLQTNLLALPVALLYSKWCIELLYGVGVEKEYLVKIVTASVFLGLWHPWTFMYFASSVLLASILLARDRGRGLLYGLLFTLPGFSAHALSSLVAGFSGLVSVVASSVYYSPFLHNLKVFMWGTGLRGEILLAASLVMLGIARAFPKTLGNPVSAWLFFTSLPVFVGIVLPMSKLFIRLLVNAPLPLLLVCLAPYMAWGRKLLVAMTLTTMLSWFFLVLRAAPIPMQIPLL